MMGVTSRLTSLCLNGKPSPRDAFPRRRIKLSARAVPHAGNGRGEWDDPLANAAAAGHFRDMFRHFGIFTGKFIQKVLRGIRNPSIINSTLDLPFGDGGLNA
jgi:hypothetical protein